MDREATERNDVESAMRHLEIWRAHIPTMLARFRPWIELHPGDPVLDIGAAQGVTVTALTERGFAAQGVEPSPEALATRVHLIERTGVETDIVQGVAERLPFEDASFRYVHCYSVLEHVDDPWQVFREAHRVLRPGGGFFFSTTSSANPRQNEISRFPLFPWYPDAVRRSIMGWAAREKPWLVGYTTRPAIHWFKHREVVEELRRAGFSEIVDQWRLRAHDGLEAGVRGRAIGLAASRRPVRVVGNLVAGVEYLAVK